MRAYAVDNSSVCETLTLVPSETSARKSSRCDRLPTVIGPPFAPPLLADDPRQSQQLTRERRALFFARRQIDRDGGLAVEDEHTDREPRRQLLLARRDGQHVIAMALFA